MSFERGISNFFQKPMDGVNIGSTNGPTHGLSMEDTSVVLEANINQLPWELGFGGLSNGFQFGFLWVFPYFYHNFPMVFPMFPQICAPHELSFSISSRCSDMTTSRAGRA